MDKFSAIQSFIVVAEQGSFAAAARQLGVTASILTRRVAGLEHELNVTLLARNTRQLALTPAGQTYLARCREVLSSLEDVELDLAESNAQPVGRLHVQLPVVVARLHVVPRLEMFLSRYPRVDLRITQRDGLQDLVSQGIDLAVWGGDLPDSRLVARPLTRNVRVTCATPAYLDRHGRPESIEELSAHNCLRAEVFHGGRAWLFQMPEGERLVPIQGNLLVDNGDNYREAVLAGLGLGQGTSILFDFDVRRGRLEQVLTNYVAKGQTVWAVYPQAQGRNPKVRAFVQFLTEILPQGGTEDPSHPPA
ncbi:LysR family transcriptional regulator [Paraburkholderia sp. RL17-347-BIC-D]|uniref:LysR family transcriptional regulator n=1 Tax=Paraburkholderia sp. RL17-347-BIC-D TaxID=3031632 RepID=UPI0038BD1E10